MADQKYKKFTPEQMAEIAKEASGKSLAEVMELINSRRELDTEAMYMDALTARRDSLKLESDIDKYGAEPKPDILPEKAHGERAASRIKAQSQVWKGSPLAVSDSAKVFSDTGDPRFEPVEARKAREAEELESLVIDTRSELEELRKERNDLMGFSYEGSEEDEAYRVGRLREIDSRIEQLAPLVGNEVDQRLIERKRAMNAKRVMEITGQSIEQAQQDAYVRLDELYRQHGSVVMAITAFIEEIQSLGLTMENLEITDEMLLGK